MRTLPRSTVLVILCSGVLALSMAPVASGVSGDRIVGHGRLEVGGATLLISVGAQSGPSGEDPDGTIRIDRTGTHTLSGVADVVCLQVSGDDATTVGRLRRPVPNANEPGTTYQYVLVSATDNAVPGAGADTLNSGVTWGAPGAAPVPSCAGFLGGAPLEAGNFTVSDALP